VTYVKQQTTGIPEIWQFYTVIVARIT